MLGWMYLSFFFVQLHLRYVVAFDSLISVKALSTGKKQIDKPELKAKNIYVKIKLNKRYQPEPILSVALAKAPLPAYTPCFIFLRDDVTPEISVATPLLLSLRGPPASQFLS
ncbi:hypothetical protein MKQ70_06150 [Chitinophaga sedimenti]|uniref:hypothetical protein n=1 Tax=Chitinophaga sedimenti TaxID=2033606 RepID=UPI0020045115|nr:hypothetical protein [Chitinophaga sedimenti]MCK7554608.1 hypothetical protein [Chitinophaga sedimenti]